jgi:predicted RNA-binding protein YlxR (DUF448 family)
VSMNVAAGPHRSCRICRSRHPKSQLQRWVRGVSGFEQDLQQTAPGRGFYTCSPACAQRLNIAGPKIKR